MKALVFRKSVLRYALLRALGSRVRRRRLAGWAPLRLEEIAPPKLPTPQWVRIAPKLSGICGSDLATLCATGSPYLAPVTSMPFVMGHEVVGTITEVGPDVSAVNIGDRVVVHPALGCKVRGLDPPCDACRDRKDALCRNVTRGDLSAGIQTGYCRDTGGAFGESLVAHQSQVYKVPDGVPDVAAVLIEPFACALHGALRVSPGPDDTVLVLGCGSIGLLTIAALRAIGCRARILAVAKHEHQGQHALALGAQEVLNANGPVKERYAQWADKLQAEVLKGELGKPLVMGGADVTFDCVASSQTIDDGLRFTRSGGTFVLVGMPGFPRGVDWTPMWYQELTVRAAYAYGPEHSPDGVRDTFAIAIELMPSWGSRLSSLVGEPYPLTEFRAAMSAALDTGQSRTVKTVFALQPEGRGISDV